MAKSPDFYRKHSSLELFWAAEWKQHVGLGQNSGNLVNIQKVGRVVVIHKKVPKVLTHRHFGWKSPTFQARNMFQNTLRFSDALRKTTLVTFVDQPAWAMTSGWSATISGQSFCCHCYFPLLSSASLAAAGNPKTSRDELFGFHADGFRLPSLHDTFKCLRLPRPTPPDAFAALCSLLEAFLTKLQNVTGVASSTFDIIGSLLQDCQLDTFFFGTRRKLRTRRISLMTRQNQMWNMSCSRFQTNLFLVLGSRCDAASAPNAKET